MSTRDIIHWECQAPAHRAMHSRRGNGGVTIYEGAWAYCDAAGANDAHHWSATGGVPLESLVRWTMPNGVSAEDGQLIAANGTPKVSRKTAGVRRT